MRVVLGLEIGQHVRQGDLLIVKIGEVDAEYNPTEEIKDGILAFGELTGHVHRLATLTDESLSQSIFTEEDFQFLEEQQARLERPIVFKDESVGPRTKIVKGRTLTQNVLEKIHSPVPFLVIHYDRRQRAVSLDPEALLREGLHEAIQLPPGLYEVLGQREFVYTGSTTRREVTETRAIVD